MVCDLLQITGGATIIAAIFATIVAAASWIGKSVIGGLLYYNGIWTAEIERMVALKAEIKINVGAQSLYADESLMDALRAKYLGDDPDFRLFVPLYTENPVFDNIKKDITRLPEKALKAVVEYYKNSGVFDALLTAFESPRYEALSTSRKLDVYSKAIAGAKRLVEQGCVVVKELDSAIVIRRRYRVGLVGLAFMLALAIMTSVVYAVSNVSSLGSCGTRSPDSTKVVK